ncbi:MAG: hypothetical protein AAF206_24760 [Bacteroidota bacterium]
MKPTFCLFLIFLPHLLIGQKKTEVADLTGTYTGHGFLANDSLILSADSHFIFYPGSYSTMVFGLQKKQQQGIWQVENGSLRLNPHLSVTETEVEVASGQQGDTDKMEFYFFKVIHSYGTSQSASSKADTIAWNELTFSLGKYRPFRKPKDNRWRLSDRPMTRCAFAGPIPPEIIGTDGFARVERPIRSFSEIYIYAPELPEAYRLEVSNPGDNRYVFFLHQWLDPQNRIRDMKWAIRKRRLIPMRHSERLVTEINLVRKD